MTNTLESQLVRGMTASTALALLATLVTAGCGGGGHGRGVDLGSLGNLGHGGGGGRGGNVDYKGVVDAGKNVRAAESMSQDDEENLGQTVVIAATDKWPLYDRPALNKYVTLVGRAVASAVDQPNIRWHFGVLDSSELGAYSGPGGYVLVTRGAIAAMQDEAELAGVLAHEIAHVAHHDGFKAVKDARKTEALKQLATAVDQRIAEFTQGSDFLVDKVLKSGWSQDQETKADDSAVKLLTKSGYDAGGLPRFLKRMQQQQGGGRAKLFGTHPGTADRIARTTAQIGSAKPGATNAERFAKAAAEARLPK